MARDFGREYIARQRRASQSGFRHGALWSSVAMSLGLDMHEYDHNELPLGDYIDAPVTWMVPA